MSILVKSYDAREKAQGGKIRCLRKYHDIHHYQHVIQVVNILSFNHLVFDLISDRCVCKKYLLEKVNS
jgi:hypothetical protein